VLSTEEQVAHAVAAKLDAGTRWLLRREIGNLAHLLPASTIGRVYPKDRILEIADCVRTRTSLPGEPGHALGRQPG
jgi:hypothetical protein